MGSIKLIHCFFNFFFYRDFSYIQHWLEILNMDVRKIPIEKEMEKAMNQFDGIKYTWRDSPVLSVKKKGKVKVIIKVGDESKTVKFSELKNTDEYQEIINVNKALAKYIKENDCSLRFITHLY